MDNTASIKDFNSDAFDEADLRLIDKIYRLVRRAEERGIVSVCRKGDGSGVSSHMSLAWMDF